MQHIIRVEPYPVIRIQRRSNSTVKIDEIPRVDKDKGKPDDDHVPVEFVFFQVILINIHNKHDQEVDADKGDKPLVRDDKSIRDHGTGEHIDGISRAVDKGKFDDELPALRFGSVK